MFEIRDNARQRRNGALATVCIPFGCVDGVCPPIPLIVNLEGARAFVSRFGSRRSGVSEPLTCEGETLVVNLHGALLLTSAALRVGMKIGIHVLLTGKRAIADVVHARQIQRFGRCEKFPTPIVPLLL